MHESVAQQTPLQKINFAQFLRSKPGRRSTEAHLRALCWTYVDVYFFLLVWIPGYEFPYVEGMDTLYGRGTRTCTCTCTCTCRCAYACSCVHVCFRYYRFSIFVCFFMRFLGVFFRVRARINLRVSEEQYGTSPFVGHRRFSCMQ